MWTVQRQCPLLAPVRVARAALWAGCRSDDAQMIQASYFNAPVVVIFLSAMAFRFIHLLTITH